MTTLFFTGTSEIPAIFNPKGSGLLNMRMKFHKKLNVKISLALILSLFTSVTFFTLAYSEEVPEKVYYGVENASTMLNNIDFTDVKNSRAWAKEAICEVASLDIIKGYGNKIFGRTNNVTKEEAIAIIYRAAGREADAQLAGEALDRARGEEDKKTYAPGMWSDGYLQLAANEGLITAQELADAFEPDQTELEEGSFQRAAPARRQEVAYWLSMALGLQPVYGQQKIFNSFNDWTSADPHKVPYIEAVLVENVMNGEGNGYFRPTGVVTREQIAQIIKNAGPKILPLLGYEKKVGTIEDIQKATDFTQGFNVSTNTLNVRNSNGKLHEIVTRSSDNSHEGYKNEQDGKTIRQPDTGLIVYKGGWVGSSSLLKSGDRIEYITTADDRVRYVKVISNTSDTKYVVAKIKEVDPANSTIGISKFFDLEYPSIDIENRNFSFNQDGEDVDTTYVYSSTAEVFIDGRKSDMTGIVPGMNAILSVKDNLVTAVNTLDLRLKEQGVVSGVVEDNNPQLGYITLYDEDNQDTSSLPKGSLNKVKTYNYSDPKSISVFKNHQAAKLEDVEGGDSVYMKLGNDGVIEMISAVDNYVVKYGKVISKRPQIMTVAYDDGTQQILDVNENIPVVLDKKLVGYEALKDGDRVKLLMNITERNTALKKITVEGDERFIANIYKGIVSSVDDISSRIVLQNMEILTNGKWERVEQKGFTTLSLAEDSSFVYNDDSMDVNTAKKLLKNNPAYIAVERDYGGDEKAVLVSFKKSNDSEAPVFDDSIAANKTGDQGEITLSKEYKNMVYNSGTIIVKDNRLVTGNSINAEDTAYVVANRSYDDGNYYASVVQINERSYPDFYKIYRARIASINKNRDFTVESFSELSGLSWEYFNTSKTFKLTYDTRIVDDRGVVGQRDFVDYGDSSFKDRPVYILANGSDAVLINTAPYGNINAKGEIYEISGGNTQDTEATGKEEPTGFKLLNAKIYDPAVHMWVDSEEMSLNILENSIILKNNSIVKPSGLKKGDRVRVVKKESNETGDAYIIFVE